MRGGARHGRAYARLRKLWRAQFALARCRFNDCRMAGYLHPRQPHRRSERQSPLVVVEGDVETACYSIPTVGGSIRRRTT